MRISRRMIFTLNIHDMKLFTTLQAFAAIVIMSISCTETAITTDSRISGSVSDKTTGAPVPTVQLTLNPGGASTVTGTDGSFSFQNLNPGEYTITLTKEGYNTGTDNITVSPGQQVQVHLLIERIPANITADCEMLDFGETASVNSLSFNIVNSSYETLSWEVTHNCPWLSGIEPSSGILESGKTATIVVSIDRVLLKDGENETVIIVQSDGNGSTEIKIKAARYEKPHLPVVEYVGTAGEMDWMNGTGTFIYNILDAGYPAYTEKGIIINTYNDNSTFIRSDRIAAQLDKELTGQFQIPIQGFSIINLYTVQAYATNASGMATSQEYAIELPEYIDIPLLGLSVMTTDIGSGKFNEVDIMCNSSIAGGYTDWRLPDINELMSMYTLKDEIGRFADWGTSSSYWSSSIEESERQYISFINGNIYGTDMSSSKENRGRCVRTL